MSCTGAASALTAWDVCSNRSLEVPSSVIADCCFSPLPSREPESLITPVLLDAIMLVPLQRYFSNLCMNRTNVGCNTKNSLNAGRKKIQERVCVLFCKK